MKNLFIENLDITDFVNGGEIEKVASIVSDVRDNAKKSYIPSYEEQEEMPDKNFAIVLHNSKGESLKKFACHNADLTELNISFLIQAMGELPEEVIKVAACNLTTSAHKFGIPVPIELEKYAKKRYCSRVVDVDKIDISKYANKSCTVKATPTKHALGNKYPISNKKELTKAAEWFGRNYSKLSLDEQRDFISNVAAEGKIQEVDLTKTAMAGFVNLDESLFNNELYAHVAARRSLVPEDKEDLKMTYNDLLRRADSIGAIKTAYVLEMLDKEAGLDYYYGKNLVDPLRASLGTVKTAGKDIDGTVVTREQLQKLDPAKLTELVGNTGIKDLRGEEGLTILASYPLPIRKEIINLI